MPLTINVGLSRKASENYQSTGTSINITAELDQSLLAQPDELQGQIAKLYHEAETALDRRVAPPEPKVPQGGTRGIGEEHPAGTAPPAQGRNGNGNGNGHGSIPPMTESQNRAIHAIARRLGLDPATECTKMFSWNLECLTVREASALIDHLKALQTTATTGS